MNFKELTTRARLGFEPPESPRIYEEPGSGALIIVGRYIGDVVNVHNGEVTIRISRKLLLLAIAGPISRWLVRFGL